MAPEVIENNGDGYDIKADIWSLGITALELALGSPPYVDETIMKVIVRITQNPAPELPNSANFSNEFRMFVTSCLQKDPIKRPNIDQLLVTHKSFFSKCKDKAYLKDKLSVSNQGNLDLGNNVKITTEKKDSYDYNEVVFNFDDLAS